MLPNSVIDPCEYGRIVGDPGGKWHITSCWLQHATEKKNGEGYEIVVLRQQTAPTLSPKGEKGYHGVSNAARTVEDQQRLLLVVSR